MAELSQIINELESDYNNLRALLYCIKSVKFQELYSQSENQIEVHTYIKNQNLEQVKNWIKREQKKNLNFSGIIVLREIAKQMGIKNYLQLAKDDLLGRIKEERVRRTQA